MRRRLKGFGKRWLVRGQKIWVRLLRIAFVRFAYNVAMTLGRDYVGIMAAGISYYAVLSVFPIIVGLISILGFLLPSEDIYNTIFNFLNQYLPTSTEFLESTIRSIIELRGTLGVIAIAGLIFAGTAVLSAISQAVNRAWNLWPRPMFIRKPQEIAMILILGLVILLLFGLSTALSLLGNVTIPGINILQFIIAKLFSFLLLMAIFLLLYKFVLSMKVRWRDIWLGALFSAAVFQLALFGFTVFVQNFADYELIYGAFASLVVILVWIYISSFILIIGAEINVVYNRMFKWHSA